MDMLVRLLDMCCVMKRRIRFQSLINLVPNVAALNMVHVKLG
jgi:hypothetical protein